MKILKSVSAAVLALFFAANAQAQTLKDAIKYSENEQYDLADIAFKKLIASEPANGDVYYYYGKNFISTEDLDSAQVMFKMGAEKAPTNPLNHIGLGAVAMYQGKKTEGVSLVDKGVQWSDSKTISVLIEAAYSLINAPTKDTAKAMQYLVKARSIDLGKDNKPKNADLYIALGDVFLETANGGGNAMNNYEKAIMLDKKNVHAYLRQGQLWVRARNFESALKSYNDAIKTDSLYAPAYREKGDFYFLFDKFGLAKEQYKKYLALAKNNFKARQRYAKFIFLAKQYNDANVEIDKILAVDSNLLVFKRLKAISLYETRKYEEGLKYMNKFLAQQPKEKLLPIDYEYFGKLLVKNNQDSLALKVLMDVYNQDTTKKDITGDIGGAYLKTKNYAEAIRFFKMKTATKGVITADWLNLGLAHYQLGQYGKADTAYAKAVVLQPDAAITYLKRAQANAKMDPDSKNGLAKPYYETYITKIKPEEVDKNKKPLAEAYSYLGSYYLTVAKDYTAAKAAYNKILSFDPDNTRAKDALELKELKDVVVPTDMIVPNTMPKDSTSTPAPGN